MFVDLQHKACRFSFLPLSSESPLLACLGKCDISNPCLLEIGSTCATSSASVMNQQQNLQVCEAQYNLTGQAPNQVSFVKGDKLEIHASVDANWYIQNQEGQRKEERGTELECMHV